MAKQIKKTLLFIRHANREPISVFSKIPETEQLLKDRISKLSESHVNSNLIEVGIKSSQQKGIKLREQYDLDNALLFSSPVDRCVQTMQHLTGRKDIIIDDMFQFKLNKAAHKKIVKIEDITKVMEETFELRAHVNSVLNVKFTECIDFVYVLSSIICYKDLGVDISKYLGQSVIDIIHDIAEKVYNIYYDNYVKENPHHVTDTIKKLLSLDNNTIVIATHDGLIYSIAKYYLKKHLPLPEYLATVKYIQYEDDSFEVVYDHE